MWKRRVPRRQESRAAVVTRRRLLAPVLAILAFAATPAVAAAHARLEGSSPVPDARLANPPKSVVFRFSEPVTLAPGSVRVFDPRGRDVERGRTFHPAGRPSEAA